MTAAGVDPAITEATAGAVSEAGAIGDQAMAGVDPNDIDYSGMTSSTLDATG